MPPSNRAAPQLRWLAGFGVLVAAIYALVFFTGDSRPTPKLGIDLQGGTRVTLTPRTPDGKRPSHDSLVQAQNIIDNRVNGLGVAGSQVEIDGDNLVITVPGDQSGQARALASTAKLLIRPVLQAIPAPANPPQLPESPPPANASPEQKAQQEITTAKTLRQSADPQTQQLAMSTLDCHKADPLAGNDDPNLPLVACSSDGKQVLALDRSRLDGQQIANATSDFNQQQGQYEVRLDFKSSGSDAWAKLTGDYVQQQVAFVLDSQVVSAPTVEQGPQQGGQTQITGQFTAAKAKELANSLKYGSLPLSFRTSEAQTVSATLGLASLRAGLLAGAVGLGVVLLYCLVYYRLLGLLTGLSLVASGVAVYGVMVLLGRWIGFTLDLAGIAGLIIGIGMTADSFVVFFERIKDEIRDGRTFRSAVPRGWQRARRTVLSGNAVSFIAAAVLYVLAVGQVRGFAFTLGLTTILDVVVLFGVTAPLVQLAARRAFWARPGVNGLGAVQQLAEARKAAVVAEEGGKREHIAL